MKGGWLHNHLLVERVLQRAGPLAIVRREVRVDAVTQRSRSVDAVIDWPHLRAVLEAGNSEARVLREAVKAQDLDADVLLIVTPTPTVTRRVRAALRRAKLNKSDLSIIVLSQGAACQWVANQSHLMSAMYVLRTSDNKPPNRLVKCGLNMIRLTCSARASTPRGINQPRSQPPPQR